MMDNGRIDYLLVGRNIIDFHCRGQRREDTASCVKAVGEPIAIRSIRAAVMQDHRPARQLTDSLDNGLLKIYQDEQMAELFVQCGYSDKDYQRWLESMAAASKPAAEKP